MIRCEREGDITAIHELVTSCFPTAAEAMLIDLLRSGGNLAVSLVDEREGRIVGHVAFSPVTSTSGRSGIGLAPLAVHETLRRRGIAESLVKAGLEMSRKAGYDWAVVLGEPKYYSRLGFRAASDFAMSDEYGGGAAFQVLELVPGQLPADGRMIRYAPEFASLG